MINQILALLAFNPSLITQVSFYARRLKQETSIRRLGMILIIFSMLVQILVVMAPPEKSLAYSDTNIINGVKDRDDIVAAWNKSGSDIPSIYGHFGVTLADIKALPKLPDVTIKSNAADYWSTGRLSLSGFSNIEQKYQNSEIPIDVGPTTIYMRQLKAWDIKNPYNTYKAFKGKKKSDGKTFWIVVDCGNYIQIGKIETPKPTLEIRKTISPKSTTLSPGDELKFRIEYRNKTSGSVAENTILEDSLDLVHFDIVEPKGLPIFGNVLRQKIGNLPYKNTYNVLDIKVRLKNNLTDGQKICNTARIDADNAPPAESTVCSGTVNIETDSPPGQVKTVKNLTQNLEGDAALKAPLKVGDVLEYKLITTNTQPVDRFGYTVEDYIGDLLDYAELDVAHLSSQGGVFNKDQKKVTWANQVLEADSDTIKTFRIKMKSPIPSTNSPSALTTSFDCKISNEFGNELSMDVVCPLVKGIEQLPNTGPGTTLAIAFSITALAAYFFARSHLLAKELDIIKHEQAVEGGV